MTYPLRREIVKADSAFTVRVNFPEHWAKPTKVTLNVRDMNGTALVSDATATILTADVSFAATTRGSKTVALVGATAYESDDLFRVGSDAEGYQQAVVESYSSGSQTITATKRWNFAFSTGSAVEARFATYELDASGWDADVKQVTCEWDPGGDDAPIVEEWQVLSRIHDLGGLEERFDASYPTEYSEIPADTFAIYQDRAHNIIKTRWANKNLKLDFLVGSDDEYEELMLLQIAYLANPSDVNESRFNNYFESVANLPHWIDEDQDLIKEETEVRAATSFASYQRKF
jgi:hypothetical protein